MVNSATEVADVTGVGYSRRRRSVYGVRTLLESDRRRKLRVACRALPRARDVRRSRRRCRAPLPCRVGASLPR